VFDISANLGIALSPPRRESETPYAAPHDCNEQCLERLGWLLEPKYETFNPPVPVTFGPREGSDSVASFWSRSRMTVTLARCARGYDGGGPTETRATVGNGPKPGDATSPVGREVTTSWSAGCTGYHGRRSPCPRARCQPVKVGEQAQRAHRAEAWAGPVNYRSLCRSAAPETRRAADQAQCQRSMNVVCWQLSMSQPEVRVRPRPARDLY
jgi:hypothetical protein